MMQMKSMLKICLKHANFIKFTEKSSENITKLEKKQFLPRETERWGIVFINLSVLHYSTSFVWGMEKDSMCIP